MARKKTETVAPAPVVVAPTFTLKMSNKGISFGVEIFEDKIVTTGTPLSEIKTMSDLETFASLVSEVSERIDLESMELDLCSRCEETEEDFCGPCYCGR